MTVVMIEFDASADIMAKNIPQVSKFLKDRGVGKEKLLSKSFLSPRKNIKSHYPAFSFGTRGAKEKAWQKENAVFYGLCPNPQVF